MEVVYFASNALEAEIVKGMLVAQGVEAVVQGYYLQGGIGELAAIDAIKVCVHEEAIAEAQAIISEYDQKEINSKNHKGRI